MTWDSYYPHHPLSIWANQSGLREKLRDPAWGTLAQSFGAIEHLLRTPASLWEDNLPRSYQLDRQGLSLNFVSANRQRIMTIRCGPYKTMVSHVEPGKVRNYWLYTGPYTAASPTKILSAHLTWVQSNRDLLRAGYSQVLRISCAACDASEELIGLSGHHPAMPGQEEALWAFPDWVSLHPEQTKRWRLTYGGDWTSDLDAYALQQHICYCPEHAPAIQEYQEALGAWYKLKHEAADARAKEAYAYHVRDLLPAPGEPLWSPLQDLSIMKWWRGVKRKLGSSSGATPNTPVPWEWAMKGAVSRAQREVTEYMTRWVASNPPPQPKGVKNAIS